MRADARSDDSRAVMVSAVSSWIAALRRRLSSHLVSFVGQARRRGNQLGVAEMREPAHAVYVLRTYPLAELLFCHPAPPQLPPQFP
jgi:hypothetical protein